MAESFASQCGFGNFHSDCNDTENIGFGSSCNRSFFETLIMLVIVIWLLRWLFSCAC